MNSLYLYLSLRHPGRVKIGYSGNCENRRKQLARDLRSVVIGGGMWMIFANKVEKALHGIYAPLNAKMPDHSGKDEWFWIVNPLTYFFACLVFWVKGTTGPVLVWSLAIIVFPLPFDLMICYGLYWFAQLFILKTVLPFLSTGTALLWLYLKYWFLSFIQN